MNDSLYDIPLNSLDGRPASLRDHAGEVLLLVNVASRCGLTPQYEGLEKLHRELAARGFLVLGFPCNDFAGQEPGTPEEIGAFCSSNYGVSFPLFAKLQINSAPRHPLYAALIAAAPATVFPAGSDFRAKLAGYNMLPANASDVLSLENRQAISRTLANLETVSTESRVVVQQLHEALSPHNMRLMSSTLQHIERTTAQAAPLLADARALVTRLQGVSDRIDTTLAEQTAGNGLIPRLSDLSADLSSSSHQLNRVLQMLEDSPQSLIFGRPKALPGPGEPGFVVPAGAGATP